MLKVPTKVLSLALLAFAACGDDDDERTTPNDVDGGVDATVPPFTRDIDGGRMINEPDAAAYCAIFEDLTVFSSGGLTPYRYRYQITTSGKLVTTRLSGAYDAGASTPCSEPLAACGPDSLDVEDLKQALLDPVVVSAYNDGVHDRVWGRDWRPTDGTILVLKRDDGRQLQIGGDCDGLVGCTEVPAQIERVRTVLNAILGASRLDGGASCQGS